MRAKTKLEKEAASKMFAALTEKQEGYVIKNFFTMLIVQVKITALVCVVEALSEVTIKRLFVLNVVVG